MFICTVKKAFQHCVSTSLIIAFELSKSLQGSHPRVFTVIVFIVVIVESVSMSVLTVKLLVTVKSWVVVVPMVPVF